MKILLADDEPTLRVTLADDLAEAGHQVTAVADGQEALARVTSESFDCILVDLKMPGADGMTVLRAARQRDMDAIVITGAATVTTAVEAMKLGAYDYLQKPFYSDELLLVLSRLAERMRLSEEVAALREELRGQTGFGRVIGQSDAMRPVLELARRSAGTDATVVIVGESGTGKEVLARSIHQESSRSEGPFIPMSCATLNANLLEDELFGHEKGAFTDAKEMRQGLFELAHGGTLLLDDIDDMRAETQAKLLRVLQEREFVRVGGTQPIHVDIRVIVASKIDLMCAVRERGFREDLYYRLNVIQMDLPPLRDRSEDIPALVEHFLRRHGGGEAKVTPAALQAMMAVPWEGNVRQLENAVRRALALRGPGEALAVEHLLPRIVGHAGSTEEAPLTQDSPLAAVLREAEHAHIRRVLLATGGNRTQAAERLGISRKTLWEKMKAGGIE